MKINNNEFSLCALPFYPIIHSCCYSLKNNNTYVANDWRSQFIGYRFRKKADLNKNECMEFNYEKPTKVWVDNMFVDFDIKIITDQGLEFTLKSWGSRQIYLGKIKRFTEYPIL